MKLSALLASALFLAVLSCESHDWERTKVLHESHGDHDDHGEDHAGHEDHGDQDPSENEASE
jgi:hypothetical protein